MYTIDFMFDQEGLPPLRLFDVEAGQSILELALKNKIGLQHQCGGICACTSCHLYVVEGMGLLEGPEKREKDFIARAISPRSDSRLGCQAYITDGGGNIRITVPDQTLIQMIKK